jgi:broad specificity phosphatase PhoE
MDFSAVYSSPLERAAETAKVIAFKLGLEVRLDDALMEVDVGSWSGLTRSEIEGRYAEGYARWRTYGHGWDDGETYEELGVRVVAGLRRIAQSHPDQHVLVVTHGGPIRSALAAADRVPFGSARRSIAVLENCATVRIVVQDGILERLD